MATLEILFQAPSGETSKAFSRRPLGMEFVQKTPIIVTMVRGEAQKLGVRKGWQIKAIGGESLEGKEFDEAWAIFRKSVEPLHQEFIVRDFPLAMKTVADFRGKFGPLDNAEVVPFLKRFGYAASAADKWEEGSQPELKLGVIDGHRERGSPVTHTWYALHGRLTPVGCRPRRWQVERRLAHMRSLVHGPVKSELGKDYDKLFEGTHFARHAGPPGTTMRLEAWLTTMSKHINEGRLSPAVAASTLRFLEAPELPEPFEDGAVAAVGAGNTGRGEEEEEAAARAAKPAGAVDAIPDDHTEDGDEGGSAEAAAGAATAEADDAGSGPEDGADAGEGSRDPGSPGEAAQFMSL